MPRPTGISTVGDLRRAVADGSVARRDVHQEVRENLITKLRSGEPLFPGIVGYDDTVVPQLINALLSQHNFILLGLRGQAKTRLLRALVSLLDEEIPVMPGCEINDDPLDAICSACRARLAAEGDKTPVAWLGRDARYVEKLATPDVMMAFTANPEDYTARGKIITPLKDRIGSEIRTHYPAGRGDAMAITAQEAWMARDGVGPRTEVPTFVAEVVEEIAFQARQDRRIDKRSGVSQRLPISAMENVVSNAERRALMNREECAVARVTDIYAALPSITGKFEMEYEGELKGAELVGRELIRAAVANVADGYLSHLETRQVIEWFDLGGSLQLADTMGTKEVLGHAREVQGLVELAHAAGIPPDASPALLASGVDFVLEGLYALKKIGRSDERGYQATETPVRRPAREDKFRDDERTIPSAPAGKKKYYN